MILKTTRLILRPWKESDAKVLYQYAKDPRVGPMAGWPIHTSEENSLQIIKDVLSAKETYAVTIRDEEKAIGSIGLMIGDKSNLNIPENEAEIGYWIGVPYWGCGFIPEAVQELMRYAFDELGMAALWCGYFDGNEKSKRVNEKCGFRFHHTLEINYPLLNDTKTLHITCISKDEWQAQAAK